ncbi:hypothetical protein Z967_11960 [Clostridium novyi A str. 4540]|uniref:DUF5659 domain-containing protein n=1 Tax=Clostridium novyi TaxID=1542 RepID=UPI0004D3A857|nr:DUF5659 domain-containing protein [Clostridium novyi]KEH88973.1 hypothetical protein Z967_11960 [Clostridium novyi A str. 4540]
MIEEEHIDILSKNKIAWLKSNGIREIGKKIIHKENKDFVAYVYVATEELKNALLEYKYDGNLQDFIRSFKEVNSEMFLYLMENREK